MSSKATLEAAVMRLASIHPVNIWEVSEVTGEGIPWYVVDGAVVHQLVIREVELIEQVQLIAAQIMHWGRLSAQAKRVWEIEERNYRIWRDGTVLKLVEVAAGEAEKKKALPQWQAEAMMRDDPHYRAYQLRLERAEEAYNVAQSVLEGFQAKKEMMKSSVIRSKEDGAPRLSI
jgi:hypothetical protein